MLRQPEYSQDDGLHTIEHGGENPAVEYVTLEDLENESS